MKKFKNRKLAAMLAAMMLATTMTGGMTAFAATTITVKPAGTSSFREDAKFNFYKILNVTKNAATGGYDYTVNDKYKAEIQAALTAVGTNETDVVAYLRSIGTEFDNANAKAFAEKLKAEIEKTKIAADKVIEYDSTQKKFTGTVDDGYYLMLDEHYGGAPSLLRTAIDEDGSGNSMEIIVKGDYPSVEKKVMEESYTTDDGYGEGYNDVADYDIGDTVPFSFYSKVPNMTGYDKYEITFHDEMSEGLTFNEGSVKLKIGDQLIASTDYQVKPGTEANCTFEVMVADLIALQSKYGFADGADIRLDFNAELNKNAEVGLPGNPNEVYLEYSSKPKTDETNKTPKDKVVVFTFEVDVTKVGTSVDTNGKPIMLDGAKFKLYSEAPTETVENGKTVYTFDSSKEISVSIQQKKDADGNGVVDSEGNPVQEANRYYVDKNGKALIISNKTAGPIEIFGLDSGTYYLEEIEAPNGYNKLTAPIEITVTATYINNRQEWVTGDALTALAGSHRLMSDNTSTTLTGDINEGDIEFNVVNNSGTLLPETGGMGTIIFYVIGTVLMAGVVFVITAKGKKKEENL